MADDNQPFLGSIRSLDARESSPRFVDITSDEADIVFDALSSGTARDLYAALRDEPATPSDLADQLETSIQNVHYHVRNLRDADLIKEVGTGYSEKGIQVSVYGPADEPLVLGACKEETTSRLRAFLTQFVGVVTLFAGVCLLVQVFITNGWFGVGQSVPVSDSPWLSPLPTFTEFVHLPPGFVFFAGGLTMFGLFVVWLATSVRPKQGPD